MHSKQAMPNLVAVMVFLGMATSTLAEELDAYGGFSGIQGEKTGFFHVEQIDGRQWFITPEGNAFFAVGLSHLYSGDSDLACANVYGGDVDAWLEGSFRKASELGYNCALGSATSPERNLNGFVDLDKAEAVFRRNNFPYSVGVILLKHPWEFVEGETLPDIFDPGYEDLIKSRAAAVCPKYKDDPLVMGYFYGFGAFNSAATWVNHHMSLPEGAAGREAVVDLLIKRYQNDTLQFNRVYGTCLTDMAQLKSSVVLSYEEIYEHRNYPDVRPLLNQEMLDDFEAIISHMCTRLYRIGHDAIRRWDQNHLILGSFVKEWALSIDSWKAVAPYVDVIAPQHLNRDISVNALAEAVDLPMIISDDEIGFCYSPGPGYCCVESHAARGELYEANLMRNFKDPQIIGASYCACMYDQSGKALKYKQQAGFYDIEGNPRPDLIRSVTAMNKSVYVHSTNHGSQEELASLMDRYFSKWDQYKRLSQWERNQIKQLDQLKRQQKQKREADSAPQ